VLQDPFSSESFILPARICADSRAGTRIPESSKLYEFTITEHQEFKDQLATERDWEGNIFSSCLYIVLCPPACSRRAGRWWSRKQLEKRLLLRALAIAELGSCRLQTC